MLIQTCNKPFWKSQNNRITPNDIERYVAWADQKIYYTMPNSGEVADWTWILDTFKQQMFSYGVDIFVIDAFKSLLKLFIYHLYSMQVFSEDTAIFEKKSNVFLAIKT